MDLNNEELQYQELFYNFKKNKYAELANNERNQLKPNQQAIKFYEDKSQKYALKHKNLKKEIASKMRKF